MTTSKTLTHEDITSYLQGFYGSDTIYKHALRKKLLYTQGIKAFAEYAHAYWFIDLVAMYFPSIKGNNIVNDDTFNIIYLNVTNNKAIFEIKHDSDMPAFLSQEIMFTDLPQGQYKFYLCDDVLMLPSEY